MGGHGVRMSDPDEAEHDPAYGAALARYLAANPTSPDALSQRSQAAPLPAPSLLERLATPALWERRTTSVLTDLLRRASTPAPWETAVSGQLRALLEHLRS